MSQEVTSVHNTFDVLLWPHLRDKFPDVGSSKVDYDIVNKIYHITLYFVNGHTQVIYLPEHIILGVVNGSTEELLESLELYRQDQLIYELLLKNFPDGNAYGFRMVGNSNEWVARINYPNGTYQDIEGTDRNITTVQDKKQPNRTSVRNYVDLHKDLESFIEDPEILRERMIVRSKYGESESFDSLFDERDI
jgi:hypothetical protein